MRSRAYYRCSPVSTSISELDCGWYAASFIGEGAGGSGGPTGAAAAASCGAAGAPDAQAPVQEPSAQSFAQLPVPHTVPHWQQTVCTTHLMVGFSTSTAVLMSFVRVRTAAQVG